MKSERSAAVWLVAITFLWGLSFVVVKGALQFTGPHWFLFLRFSLAGVTSLFLFPQLRRVLDREAVRNGIVLSVALYVGFAFQTAGLQFTTPAKSAFITGACVVLVPVFGLLLFRIRFTRSVGLGVITALIGLYLLTDPTGLREVNHGDFLTFLCAVVFALHILLVSRYVKRSDPSALAVLQLLFAGLWSLPLALWFDKVSFRYPASFYLAWIYLAVFCSALAFAIQIRAQRRVPASRAALIFSLEPVFAAIASVVLYGEHLLWREWIGGALVVSGVLLGEASVLRSKCGTRREAERINHCRNELG